MFCKDGWVPGYQKREKRKEKVQADICDGVEHPALVRRLVADVRRRVVFDYLEKEVRRRFVFDCL